MSNAVQLDHAATLADLQTLPDGVRGEIIDGVLYTQPRPRAQHAKIELLIGDDIVGPYQRGRGGPGGWWILVEPGIELPDAPEIAPDLAGWRQQRLPLLPRDTAIRIVPDWICEIHSPSTRGYDLVTKRRFYARIGVSHLWYVDPEARSLTVGRLQGDRYVEIAVYGESEKAHCEPFTEVELDLAEWWAGVA